MVRSSGGLVVLLVLLGCGGNGDDAAGRDAGADTDGGGSDGVVACEARSGDRLRLRRIDGGVTVIEGLYDPVYSSPCTVGVVDGARRCLPDQIVTGTSFYTDAGCTQRLVQPAGLPVLPIPELHRELVTGEDACLDPEPIYRPVTGTMELVGGETLYAGTPDACNAIAAAAGTYHSVGAPLPGDAFVAFDDGVVAAGARVELRVQEGADGSRICTGAFYDRDLEATCGILAAEDGAPRCLPGFGATTDLFSDVGCTAATEVVVASSFCGAPTPRWVGELMPAFCPSRLRLREVGAAIDEPAYTGSPEVCTEFAPGEVQSLLSVGPSVAPNVFAESVRTHVATDGRLQRGEHQIGDRLVVTSPFPYDPDLDIACRFEEAADASLRCVPHGLFGALTGEARTAFSDAACTVPADVGVVGGSCVDEVPAYAVSSSGRVFPIGEPVIAPVYVNSGVCVLLDPSNLGVFSLGTEILPDMLVEGVRTTE